jgi:hypothetical protein
MSALPPKADVRNGSDYVRRNSSSSFAKLAAIRRASWRTSTWAGAARAAPSLRACRVNAQLMDRPRLWLCQSRRGWFGTPTWSYRPLPRRERRLVILGIRSFPALWARVFRENQSGAVPKVTRNGFYFTQEVRQLCHVSRNPPRFVFGELRAEAAAALNLAGSGYPLRSESMRNISIASHSSVRSPRRSGSR